MPLTIEKGITEFDQCIAYANIVRLHKTTIKNSIISFITSLNNSIIVDLFKLITRLNLKQNKIPYH